MYVVKVARSQHDGMSSSVELTFGGTHVPLRIMIGNETTEHGLVAAECEWLHQLLCTVRIAPGPSYGVIALGNSVEVTIERGMNEASYRWTMHPPVGWEALAEIVEECYRLAATRYSGYLW